MGNAARGSRSFLSYKPETVYGVSPGGNFTALSISSETFAPSINPVQTDEIQRRRSTPAVRGGNRMTGGNIVLDLSPTRHAVFLAHLMGLAYTSTTITVPTVANATAYLRGEMVKNGTGDDYLVVVPGTTSGAAAADLDSTTFGERIDSGTATLVYAGPTATAKYQHRTKGNVDFLTGGLHFEKAVLGQTVPFYEIFRGARINQLAVAVAQEGASKATYDFLFSGFPVRSGVSGAGTVVDVAEDFFVGYEAAVVINDSMRTTMKDANFTISNNCEADDFRIGSRDRANIPPRRRELNGSMTAVFEDDTEYALFENEEKFSLAFQFYHGGNFLEFLFPECKFFGDPSPKIGGGGQITSQFSFTGFQQDEATDIQITLKTTDATYTV
jgi:hypothetical protein